MRCSSGRGDDAMFNEDDREGKYQIGGMKELYDRLMPELGTLLLDQILAMSVEEMFGMAKHSFKKEDVDAMKEKINERLMEYIEGEGYPTAADREFKKAHTENGM
ncbi:hypothetical protein EV426DRAFT_707683 [Tirmania nivea]|nr:hypothetical protein EV426DRAFT_707683 [Tirmania nivea]